MLLEKYIAAAKTVIAAAVPTNSKTVAENTITGRRFRGTGAPLAAANDDGPLSLSYYQPAMVTSQVRVEHAGRYQIVIDLTANERFVDGVFDLNRCRLTFKVDGRDRLAREFSRQDGRAYHDVIDENWQPGEHRLAIELQPLTPAEPQVRSLTIRLKSVTIRGPLEEEHWVRPNDYTRFFPKDIPLAAADRQRYARELLERFADQSFSAPCVREDRRSTGGIRHRHLRAGRTNVRGRHCPGDDGRAGVSGISLSRGNAVAGVVRAVSARR